MYVRTCSTELCNPVFSSENLVRQFIGEGAGLCNLTLSPCEGHIGPREEVSVEYEIVWMEKVRT